MRTRNRKKSQGGFTLTELTVVVLLTTISSTFIYFLFEHNSRIYNIQNDLSNAQAHLRYASARLQRDLNRAGYMGIINQSDKRLCVPLGMPPLDRSLDAIFFQDGQFRVNANQNFLEADRIYLFGNFDTNEDFDATIINNTQIRVQYDPRTFDLASFKRVFYNTGQLLLMKGSNGKYQVIQVNATGNITSAYSSRVLNIAPTGLRLRRTAFCGATGRVRISPLRRIRYEMRNLGSYRYEIRRTSMYPICTSAGTSNITCNWRDMVSTSPHPPFVVAEYATDLQFWFSRVQNGVLYGYNPLARVGLPQRANIDNDIHPPFLQPQLPFLRSVFFRISVRTMADDRSFVMRSRGGSRLGALRTPMLGFNVDPNPLTAARVRSIVKHVQLNNFLIP